MSVHSRIAAFLALLAVFAAQPLWAGAPPPTPKSEGATVPDASAPKPDASAASADSAAKSEAAAAAAIDAKEKSLVKRDGTIQLPGGQARIDIAEEFAFLDAGDAKKLLVEIWGNPPDAVDGVLGVIIPKQFDLNGTEHWAAVVTYENDGHVSDSDASTIDYAAMLKDMQTEVASNSEERVKAGYDAISLVGWAQAPSYDAKDHKLYWAKHLQFGTDTHTLNYAIRALGRTGVLQVNVVAGMDELPSINAKLPKLLSMVAFNDGNRYADYKEGSDPLAAYGLAALVAGGVAAKAGLFKGLLALLAASWKIVAVGVVAVGAALRRFVGGLFGGRAKGPDAP